MRTVGQILKEARESNLYTIDQVEKATKIRKELLIALEMGDYSKLPPATFVQGFIKNYSKFLNLDTEKLLAIFRREFSDKKHQPYVMDTFANPLEERRFKITPTRVLGIVISLVILSFFVYLWFQYRQLVGEPKLVLNSPPDQYSSQTEVVVVEGNTDPEIKVSINSQDIEVSSEGTFRQEITLSSPVNKIIVVASTKFGQKSQLERTVYFRSETP